MPAAWCPYPEHNTGSLAQTCRFFVCLVRAVSAALSSSLSKPTQKCNKVSICITKASLSAFLGHLVHFFRKNKKEELNIKVLNLLRKFLLVEEFYKIYPCKYYVKQCTEYYSTSILRRFLHILINENNHCLRRAGPVLYSTMESGPSKEEVKLEREKMLTWWRCSCGLLLPHCSAQGR